MTVLAQRFSAPLADPLSRDGWTGGAEPRPADLTLATLDLGDGRSGFYDFTANQWFNPLRGKRIVVRGSLGELVDDHVVRLLDATTAAEAPLVRRQTGIDLNLERYDTDHVSSSGDVVYRNPYRGARLSDEEIAIASILDGTAAWPRAEGPPPYPLAEGCHDQQVSLAVDESLSTGRAVTTTREPWSSN